MPKTNLVIVGNGFDRWVGLNTSFDNFHEYYLQRRKALMKKLHISPYKIVEEDCTQRFGPVEVFYGDPYDLIELDDDFWSSFEESLSDIDAFKLNAVFGKDRADIKDLRRCAKNADKILRKAFCDWVHSININSGKSGRFIDNCVFINFNYTATLTKKFGVDADKEFHIHGEASDPKSIIYGHTAHPQEPEEAMKKIGGRFGGLYVIEDILYKTDKHVADNVMLMITFLAMQGLKADDIGDVYILGHSMGTVDLEYFRFLADTLMGRGKDDILSKAELEELIEQVNSFEDSTLRISYAVHRYGYDTGNDTVSAEEELAIERYMKLQNIAFRQSIETELFGELIDYEEGEISNLSTNAQPPMWHISCYSDKDEVHVNNVMKELGYTNYKIYKTIDECAAEVLKVQH